MYGTTVAIGLMGAAADRALELVSPASSASFAPSVGGSSAAQRAPEAGEPAALARGQLRVAHVHVDEAVGVVRVVVQVLVVQVVVPRV